METTRVRLTHFPSGEHYVAEVDEDGNILQLSIALHYSEWYAPLEDYHLDAEDAEWANTQRFSDGTYWYGQG